MATCKHLAHHVGLWLVKYAVDIPSLLMNLACTSPPHIYHCLQVHVDSLCDKQVANQVEVRGPPASKAFDQQGNPTKVFPFFVIICLTRVLD